MYFDYMVEKYLQVYYLLSIVSEDMGLWKQLAPIFLVASITFFNNQPNTY